MEKQFSILTDESYQAMMKTIYEMMNKGEANLTKEELELLETLAVAAEIYEDQKLKSSP